MDSISILLILLSVVLGASRNIFSKGVSKFRFGTKKFFFSQFSLFLAGSIAVILVEEIHLASIVPITAMYAFIYGILLICAQWYYIAALENSNIAVCSIFYALGFIFPTISGVLFWNETITYINGFGILCVIPAVVISGLKTPKTKNKVSNAGYILPLLISMLSAGGLGIMQIVQQKSLYQEQRPEFILVGFLLASVVSFICFVFAKSDDKNVLDKKYFMSAAAGVCYGGCNLLSTALAGRLDSAMFFPVYNIGVILLSTVLSYIIFKEKMQKKDILVFSLGIISIILLNL